jgi:hypothetical protein
MMSLGWGATKGQAKKNVGLNNGRSTKKNLRAIRTGKKVGYCLDLSIERVTFNGSEDVQRLRKRRRRGYSGSSLDVVNVGIEGGDDIGGTGIVRIDSGKDGRAVGVVLIDPFGCLKREEMKVVDKQIICR